MQLFNYFLRQKPGVQAINKNPIFKTIKYT
jgi:hypothetical protein